MEQFDAADSLTREDMLEGFTAKCVQIREDLSKCWFHTLVLTKAYLPYGTWKSISLRWWLLLEERKIHGAMGGFFFFFSFFFLIWPTSPAFPFFFFFQFSDSPMTRLNVLSFSTSFVETQRAIINVFDISEEERHDCLVGYSDGFKWVQNAPCPKWRLHSDDSSRTLLFLFGRILGRLGCSNRCVNRQWHDGKIYIYHRQCENCCRPKSKSTKTCARACESRSGAV